MSTSMGPTGKLTYWKFVKLVPLEISMCLLSRDTNHLIIPIILSEWRRRAGGKSSLSGRTGGGREEGDYGGAVEDWKGVEAEPRRGRGIAR
ncbi:hypothetical protein ACLB2K_025873 [Fragaria x ananassa]